MFYLKKYIITHITFIASGTKCNYFFGTVFIIIIYPLFYVVML